MTVRRPSVGRLEGEAMRLAATVVTLDASIARHAGHPWYNEAAARARRAEAQADLVDVRARLVIAKRREARG